MTTGQVRAAPSGFGPQRWRLILTTQALTLFPLNSDLPLDLPSDLFYRTAGLPLQRIYIIDNRSRMAADLSGRCALRFPPSLNDNV